MARPAPKPRKYEMMIVVAPTVTEDGLPAVVERVTGLIEAQEGAVESATHDNPWGHRRLAYPIQNFRDAFYVLYYFDMVPRGIQELDRELRLDEAIIRHLIVKFDPLMLRDFDGDEEDEDEDAADAPVESEDDSQAVEAGSSDDDTAEADDANGDADDEDADDDADETEASAEDDDTSEDDGDDDTDDGEDDEE